MPTQVSLQSIGERLKRQREEVLRWLEQPKADHLMVGRVRDILTLAQSDLEQAELHYADAVTCIQKQHRAAATTALSKTVEHIRKAQSPLG